MIEIANRYESIEPPTNCIVRISKGGVLPYDRFLEYLSIAEQNTIIARLRQRGLKVEVFRSSGLGMEVA